MKFSHYALHLKNTAANKNSNHRIQPLNKKLIAENDQLTKFQLDGKNRRSKMPQDGFKNSSTSFGSSKK